MIETEKNKTISALRPPLDNEVQKAKEKEIETNIAQWILENDSKRSDQIAAKLLENYEQNALVSALINQIMFSKEDDNIQLSFEKPLVKKSNFKSKGGNRRGNSRKPHGKNNKRSFSHNAKKPGSKSGRPDRNNKRDRRSKEGRTFKDMLK